MHIPDGYLSPQTCGALGVAMVPVWARAGRRVRRVVKTRNVPLLAMGAAFSFLVMMFNVPVPLVVSPPVKVLKPPRVSVPPPPRRSPRSPKKAL